MDFKVIGSKTYLNNEEFVVKGTNAQGRRYGWERDITKDYSLLTEVWNFNLLRITCWLGPHKDGYPLFENASDDAIVKTFTGGTKKAVVMFEAHDMKGKYFTKDTKPSINDLKLWFKEKVDKFKDNPYVWFNLANEPGGGVAFNEVEKTKWLSFHQEMIKYIRDDLGANNIIVCDAASWAQDSGNTYRRAEFITEKESSLLSSGHLLKEFDNKKYENIVFNLHTYRAWGDSKTGPLDAKLVDYLEQCKKKGHCVFIGEYGSENSESLQATEMIHRVCPTLNVGLVAWHWGGGDTNDYTKVGGGFKIDKVDGTKPTNLTRLGTLIWDFNKKELKLATLTPPVTPVNLIVNSLKVYTVLGELMTGIVKANTEFILEAEVINVGGVDTALEWLGGNFYVEDAYVSFAGVTKVLKPKESVKLTSKVLKTAKDVTKVKFVVDNKNKIVESNEKDNELVMTL